VKKHLLWIAMLQWICGEKRQESKCAYLARIVDLMMGCVSEEAAKDLMWIETITFLTLGCHVKLDARYTIVIRENPLFDPICWDVWLFLLL